MSSFVTPECSRRFPTAAARCSCWTTLVPPSRMASLYLVDGRVTSAKPRRRQNVRMDARTVYGLRRSPCCRKPCPVPT